jgi:hypothetical protein
MEKFDLVQPSGFQTLTGQKTIGQRMASNIDNIENKENNNLSSLSSSSSCSFSSICSIVLLYFIFKGMGL